MHTYGITHTDLKPENILLVDDEVKKTYVDLIINLILGTKISIIPKGHKNKCFQFDLKN